MYFNIVSICLIFLAKLSLIKCFQKASQEQTNSLLFCVNENFHQLLTKRFPMITKELIEYEIKNLPSLSVSEYFRAHDLHGYYYFVYSINNPYRLSSCDNAAFEYIPILPFYWRPPSSFPNLLPNVSGLISDIVSFMEWDQSRPSFTLTQHKPYRFTIGSAFNYRTLLGTGMPTQVRRGYVWTTVSKFIMSLSFGNYERYPQCPDLLRRSWNYIVELPYIGMNSIPLEFSQSNTVNSNINTLEPAPKSIQIFYSGRFILFGPEIVCSIRNSITSLAQLPNTKIVNVSLTEFNGKVNMKLFRLMQQSQFCLVTKGDSYSSSSFYHAIQANCIPVVISDWFVFAFPWLIPYEKFIIRIAEKDFVKDPVSVIQKLLIAYPDNKQKELIEHMTSWRRLLSYSPLHTSSKEYDLIWGLIENQVNNIGKQLQSSSNLLNTIKSRRTSGLVSPHMAILPYELLVLELHYLRSNGSDVLPCISPFECTPNGKSIYSSFNSNELIDKRSYLCKHNSRMIGHYKMVYFMQCVRVLWPLQPGKLKSIDYNPSNRDSATLQSNIKGLTKEEYDFIMNFHNLSSLAKSRQWFYPDIYPPIKPSIKNNIALLSDL